MGQVNGVIDYSKSRLDFTKDVEDILAKCVKEGAVIPIPIHQMQGSNGLYIMSAILSMIDCSSCDAKCCRTNHGDSPIPIMEFEANLYLSKYGKKFPDIGGHWWGIKTPCSLLGTDNKCICYGDRPMVCRYYPIQTGGKDQNGNVYALDSVCPQSVIVARKFYRIAYDIQENQQKMVEQIARMR